MWEVETAWKFATDNFTDNFHVFNAHHSLVELGMLPNDPDFACYGHMITPGNGHVLHFVKGEPGDDDFLGLGLPHELRAKFAENLDPAQAASRTSTASAPAPSGRTSTGSSCRPPARSTASRCRS